MAGISTSIQIQDRVSGTLNRITASLYNATSAFGAVDRASESTFNTAAVQTMTEELYRYEERIQSLEGELVRANNRLEQMEEQTRRTASAADTMKNAFKVAASIISAIGLGKIIEASDNLTQTTSRINMMNDGLQTTPELVQMVYKSAQDARGSFDGMADVVARFGNNAKDAFSSSEEIVSFANLVQKQMTIAGASTAEASNAMLQLSQGLGSGVLRGDELNSIFEQAPNLIQNIADYLDVPIGEIRNMASEGELTADIVKNAIFAASDDINAKFNEMPMTWGQIWQKMQNAALMKFQPVLQRVNELANSDKFQKLVDGVINAMVTVSNIVIGIFDIVASVGAFMSDNWSVLSPLIYGVIAALGVYGTYLAISKGIEIAAAIATGVMAVAKGMYAAALVLTTGATWEAAKAQVGLNGAMYASPVVWILILIIALIAVLVALCNWIAKTTGVAESGIGVICGALAVAGAFIGNLVLGLMNFVIGIGVSLYNLIATFANFFANVFNDPVGAIMKLFSGLFDFILSVVEAAAGMIDTVLGTDMSGAIAGFRDKVSSAVDDIVGEQKVVMETKNPSDYKMEGFDYGNAWKAGTKFGDGLSNKMKNGLTFDTSSMDSAYTGTGSGTVAGDLSSIAGDASNISDSVDISNENLKYLHDIAERQAINRFTTAEIKVDMNNNNTINNGMDIDGVVDQLTAGVREAMAVAAEGVH